MVNEKSVYDYVGFIRVILRKNLRKINDNASEVKLFFKLPRSFKIVALIGSYTPDWGVF
ncbi:MULTISPECIES: hypothetical protein [unclassified Bartonella]|uniref:restriction endonuclease n=1 Tax=unclassified Bartonella TaxID=2645622 RepID=UPI0035D025AD